MQDPGNLGTIARSAEAFGVTGLLLGERTVSPWNWKAVRASAGSLFRVPTLKVEVARALEEIKARGVSVLATSSHKGALIADADLRGPVALLIGSEGAGVPKDVLAQADEVVAIPQSPAWNRSTQAWRRRSCCTKQPGREKGFNHGGTESTEERE